MSSVPFGRRTESALSVEAEEWQAAPVLRGEADIRGVTADTDDELKHDDVGKNWNILITASYRTT